MDGARPVSGDEHGEPTAGKGARDSQGTGCPVPVLSSQPEVTSSVPLGLCGSTRKCRRTESKASVTSASSVPSTGVDVRDTHGHMFLSLR